MQEVYDITETALREFLARQHSERFIPVGSYCAVDMSFTTDDCHPLLFCIFDVSPTADSPIESCEHLYANDCTAYGWGIKSNLYANDYEVWHVVPDSVVPDTEVSFYQVRGYVAQDEPNESNDADLCIDSFFYSYKIATEFAYTIFNSPCYRVTVHSVCDDWSKEQKILDLKSERRLYSRFAGRVHRRATRNVEV